MKYLLCILILLIPVHVLADVPATFSWEAHPDPNIAGFRLYQSTTPGQYGAPVATIMPGAATRHVIQLPEQSVAITYYFTLTAYTVGGRESAKSNEVNKIIPAAPVIAVVPKPGIPILRISNVVESGVMVSWMSIDDGTGQPAIVNVRIGLAGIGWGSMTSVPCPSSPCQIDGLIPSTKYQVQAVASRPGVPTVFGALSSAVLFDTLMSAEPIPEAPKGLTVTKATPDEVIITASVMDCPTLGISRRGSNGFVHMRTVSCRQ